VSPVGVRPGRPEGDTPARVTVVGVSAYHPPPPPAGRPGPSGRSGPPPRGRAVRVDPVVVEIVAGLLWLAVGTLGLGADGAGTLILAAAIAVGIGIGVENRRRGVRPFDPARSTEVLRLAAGVVVVVIVASIVLALISASAFLPGLAAVMTGVAFVLLSRSTGQRPTRWLGVAAIVLGVFSALVSTIEPGGFVSQGLVGLVLGVLMLVSAADRVGLVGMLRDRTR
jgi:hypothetical protein